MPIAVWDHDNVSCAERNLFPACQTAKSAPFGEQMKSDYVLCLRREVPGQSPWGRRVHAPRRCKLAVVKQRSPQFHHFQNLRKHIHLSASRTLRKLNGTLNQIITTEMLCG